MHTVRTTLHSLIRRALPSRTPAAVLALALLLTGAAAGAETLAVTGGTVHPVTAEPFVGTVVITDGTITALGESVPTPAGATVIDASGLHVYPGIFDAMSQLGLVEVDAVAATVDTTELGLYNPHLRATTAVHPASELIPVARANGITHTLVAPAADNDSVIVGQAAVLNLAGWTVEEMSVAPDAAMFVRWPRVQTGGFDFATFTRRNTPYAEAKEKADEQRAELAEWLRAARHYKAAVDAGSQRLERDLKLEALVPVIEGRQPVVIAADSKSDIEAAVAFADKEGLRMILVGGRDADKLTELLAEHQIPVILGAVLNTPEEDDDPYDRPFSRAEALHAAGIHFAFASGVGGGDPGGAHSSRGLPYEAANACAFGLPREEALRALTLYPAQILGVADRLGSLEAGKLGNLMVTDGDPLEIQTQVLHVVIGGREISTDNKHLELYERYRAR
jgi:imidazolonepropionase-like amidohydrolase